MQSTFRSRAPRRGVPNIAILGVMISIALLITWTFVSRLEGGATRPETLLLEFLTTFIVVCGALVVASAAVGLLPLARRRRRSRTG
jgi:hypothetical protein